MARVLKKGLGIGVVRVSKSRIPSFSTSALYVAQCGSATLTLRRLVTRDPSKLHVTRRAASAFFDPDICLRFHSTCIDLKPMTATPRGIGRSAMHTIDGHFDTLRHNPAELLRFRAMDTDPIDFKVWKTQSIYVHDTRVANGTPPQGANNAFDRVSRALPELILRAREIAPNLIEYPEGRDGVEHSAGGGWSFQNITFYVARGLYQGRWCKFLCANVY
jgi:hypothetical protein